jgi:hypothetical protein
LRLKAQGLRLRVNNKAMLQVSCLTPCALRLMPLCIRRPATWRDRHAETRGERRLAEKEPFLDENQYEHMK